MPVPDDERAKIRERYGPAGTAGQIEQAVAERLALREHDQDTAGPDARLAAFGYQSDDQAAEVRERAAAERKAAAAKAKDGDGKDGTGGKGPAPATGPRRRATREG
jgi:hypothetical protein